MRRVAGQDDASWRLQWVHRHRGDVEIFHNFDVHHPTRGWTLRPNVVDLPVFEGKRLNTNTHGLRGADDHAYEKPVGARRIVVLGDSFTFGEEVSDNETWPHYLAGLLPGTEVLNLGVHGYGHDQMLLYLREEGLRYHPDIVILGFVYDDTFRNGLAFRDFAKPRFVLAGETLVLEHTPVPSPAAVLANEIYRPKLLDALAIWRDSYRWRSGDTQREIERVTRALLTELARTVEAAGAVPIFVHLPTRDELRFQGSGIGLQEALLYALCQKQRLRYLSVRPPLAAAAAEQRPMILSWHYSPEGNRLAASAIRDYLATNDLLGPNR